MLQKNKHVSGIHRGSIRKVFFRAYVL